MANPSMVKADLLVITIENSGTPFSGDLVIDVQESYNLGMGRAIPLDIGSGETKTVSLILPNIDDGVWNGEYETHLPL